MPSSAGFQTYQNVSAYEQALARHGQWCRWIRTITCPCINADTGQAHLKCSLCKGRGKLYRNPQNMALVNETAKHDETGRIYPAHTPVIAGSIKVWRKGNELPISAIQPSDGSYIQIDPLYPKAWEKITIDYSFSPELYITNENSEVIGTDTLRTLSTRFYDKGKTFEGSLSKVTRVYNVSKDETYNVQSFLKEYIYVENMGTWSQGDILEVDYSYIKPFSFVVTGISPKIRFESPYILDEAESTLITPHYIRVDPDDLITVFASEQHASAVINPNAAPGNDEIKNYFDLSSIEFVIDALGNEYQPNIDLKLYGRNEIKWLRSKPNVNYSIDFLYHPTYTALKSAGTMRNAENKSFVNRMSLIQFDKVSEVAY